MKRPSRSYDALCFQRATLERSLADVKAGRNVSHLSETDAIQFASDIEKRLTKIVEELADSRQLRDLT